MARFRPFFSPTGACLALLIGASLVSGDQLNNPSACINSVVGAAAAAVQLFSNPQTAALDATGTLVFTAGNALYRVLADGSTAAALVGSGSTAGHAGDGQSFASALLASPSTVALAPTGSPLLIYDVGNNAVRAVWMATGEITHWAGNASGAAGFAGDGGLATLAALSTSASLKSGYIASLAFTSDGSVFLSDTGNNRLRMVTPGGTISTVVGTGVAGWSGDGGPGTLARVRSPGAVATDGTNMVYFFDSLNARLRSYDRATGLVAHFAGTGVGIGKSVGSPALDGALAATSMIPAALYGLAVRPSDGAVVFAGWFTYTIRAIVSNGTALVMSTVAGNGQRGFSGNGGPALSANFDTTTGLFYAPNNDLYVLDATAYVRVIRAASGNVYLIASATASSAANPTYPGVFATAYTFTAPRGLTTDRRNGDMYITDSGHNALYVWRNSADYGTRVFGFAGTGVACTAFTGPGLVCGDGGSATAALLNFPYTSSVGANGDVAFTDQLTNRVRVVYAATGTISTVLGTGATSYGVTGVPANGVPGTSSVISNPQGVAYDPATGDLYVADIVACVIRRVQLSGGAQAGYVFNVAGTAGSCGSSAAPTPPLSARIGPSYFMTIRPSDGALLFADGTYSVVYALPLSGGGNLSIVAGRPWTGTRPIPSPVPPAVPGAWNPRFGDGGPATNATLSYAAGLVVDPTTGNLFVISVNDFNVRMVDAATGTIWTVAGTGVNAYAGDTGTVSLAPLNAPRGLTTDTYGNLYIAESASGRLREVNFGGSSPDCPAGFTCACGLRPSPCSSASTYCPRGSAAAKTTAVGYISVSPATLPGCYGNQVMCPAGSYCSGGGIATPCPPGTYGVGTAQVSLAGCLTCPAGTYNAATGSVGLGSCLPCPGRSTSDAGAGFCSWHTADNGSNSTAPGACNAHSFALPGPFGGCLALPGGGSVDVVEGGADVQVAPSIYTIDHSATSTATQAEVAAPIFGAFIAPVVITALAMGLAMLFNLCSFCRPLRRRVKFFVKGVMYPLLRFSDQMGDWRIGSASATDPVHWAGTELGGACSLAAMGTIFACIAAVIIQYNGPENYITTYFVLPARKASLEEALKHLSFTTVNPPTYLPTLSRGLALSLALQGPACGTVNATTHALGAGAFTPSTSLLDNSSQLFLHTFTCGACEFLPLTSLSLVYDTTCQSAAVVIGAVGAQGAISASARVVHPPVTAVGVAPVFLASAVISTTVAAETVDDEVDKWLQRGLLLDASVTTTTAVGLSEVRPATFTLTLAFPASPTYSGLSAEPRFVPLDLTYQLLAIFAVGAFFTFAYVAIIERMKRVHLLGRAEDAAKTDSAWGTLRRTSVISVLVPGAPVIPRSVVQSAYAATLTSKDGAEPLSPQSPFATGVNFGIPGEADVIDMVTGPEGLNRTFSAPQVLPAPPDSGAARTARSPSILRAPSGNGPSPAPADSLGQRRLSVRRTSSINVRPAPTPLDAEASSPHPLSVADDAAATALSAADAVTVHKSLQAQALRRHLSRAHLSEAPPSP